MSLLLPQPEGIPAPRPSLHSRPYWEGCRRHQLLYQRCAECSFSRPRRVHGLRPVPCVVARCGRTSAGTGSLYSWTVVWRPPDPAFRVPYAPAVVHLDEGFFMLSAVIGCEPEALQEGLRLAVEFHPASDEITLPYFRPA